MNQVGSAGAFRINLVHHTLYRVARARYSIRAKIRAQWREDGRWLAPSLAIPLASVARDCTNALVYAHDLRDPVKQNKAVSLTASLIDVMWQ